ncbi:MAG: signal peptidase I [Gammaproteobacteria bacterium]
MNVDFPTVLVFATALTGAIWLFDSLLLKPRRRRLAHQAGQTGSALGGDEHLKEPWYTEYSKSFFPVILAVLLLRSFLVEPFRIPSGSMMPTLLVGDFILVNKYTYGLRLPVLNKKIVDIDSPQRGDVVVFRYPKDPSVDYIKRLIALPGDKLAYYNKILYINGQPAPQQPLGEYTGTGQGLSMSGASLRMEQLGKVKHRILVVPNLPGVQGEFVVPPGQYFMMGDNRDNSNDSRYWGPVPEQNLVGKAFMIWMSWDSSNGGVDWHRIGQRIK